MKFVALLTGRGEGCDHTIACNKEFEVFEATGAPAAVRRCKERWLDYGGCEFIEKIDLYAIAETVIVPLEEWNAQAEEEEESECEEAEEELRRAEQHAEELRSRLGELRQKTKPSR